MMQSFAYLLLTLAILIVVHEFGHFWVARRCGVKVLRFSVGFGQALWRHHGKDGTEYVVAAIPLGGYVKMLDEREGPVAPEELPRSFNRQPLRSRAAIVFAGPLANLLFAVCAYWLVYLLGVPGIKPVIGQVIADSPASRAGLLPGDEIRAVDNENTATWRSVNRILQDKMASGERIRLTLNEGRIVDIKTETRVPAGSDTLPAMRLGIIPVQVRLKPVIAKVMPQSAAAQAGLKKGDVVLAVDGQIIDDWQQLVERVQASAGQTLQFLIDRAGQQKQLHVTPQSTPEGKGKIGVMVDSSEAALDEDLKAVEKYGVISALGKACYQTAWFSWMTVKSLAGMLIGAVSSDNIGGPITIAQYASASAQNGLIAFVGFLAMISISLGILNLLPVPVLDGGHLFLYLIEWLRGEPLSETLQLRLQNVGIIVLIMLMSLALVNDLTRLFG